MGEARGERGSPDGADGPVSEKGAARGFYGPAEILLDRPTDGRTDGEKDVLETEGTRDHDEAPDPDYENGSTWLLHFTILQSKSTST